MSKAARNGILGVVDVLNTDLGNFIFGLTSFGVRIVHGNSLQRPRSIITRIINFIVDVPVRIEHLVDLPSENKLGRVVFVMVEFQILDKESAHHNEQGENAHVFYKNRQLNQVKARLRMGGGGWREKKD